MEDDKGRRILVGWMGIPEEEDYPTTENGWLHCLTLPRELKLENGKLYQVPIEEMEKIRGEKSEFSGVIKGKKEISNGTVYELKAEFSNISSDFGIKLRAGENSETVLKFDYESNKFILDREKGKQPNKSLRKVYLGEINTLSMRIFVDNSSVEVFINNGEEVFSSRIFPEKNADKIIVFSENDIDVKIEKWEWK